MTALLKTLDRAARAHVTESFLGGSTKVDFSRFERDFPRTVELGALDAVFGRAMGEFTDPVEADRWLAPRVHAALRLTRREAADRELWSYLGLCACAGYVRWRFPSAVAERFIGAENNHAVGRLWWGAELVRNGSDYADVVTAFRMQDIPNTWLRLDAFHHRPLAIGAVRLLGAWREGETATSDEVNLLAKALNLELVTLALDADVPDAGSDSDLAWVQAAPDLARLLKDDLPEGPADAVVPEDQIIAAMELLKEIAADIDLAA
ncbi:MAG: DUF6339 family protein [Gemmatimonadota bacterium]|nr:DUF6339 family protein [Gemmatimonadota bacterium]